MYDNRDTNVPNQETVPPMPNMVGFYHGTLADTYEEQANEQGYTFGDKAEWIEKVAFGIICGHIHGIITDSEYDRIMQKFQKKILLKYIKKRRVKNNERTPNTKARRFCESD